VLEEPLEVIMAGSAQDRETMLPIGFGSEGTCVFLAKVLYASVSGYTLEYGRGRRG